MIQKDAYPKGDETYRYWLTRMWEPEKPLVCFVGLNPSQADDEQDDPTIRRCIRFAQDWGYGGLYMVNLFAYRATKPADLFKAGEMEGFENDRHLIDIFSKVEKVVCAWGNHGRQFGRSNQVLKLISEPFCLRVNKGGEPAHPLYQRKGIAPVEYKSKN